MFHQSDLLITKQKLWQHRTSDAKAEGSAQLGDLLCFSLFFSLFFSFFFLPSFFLFDLSSVFSMQGFHLCANCVKVRQIRFTAPKSWVWGCLSPAIALLACQNMCSLIMGPPKSQSQNKDYSARETALTSASQISHNTIHRVGAASVVQVGLMAKHTFRRGSLLCQTVWRQFIGRHFLFQKLCW